MPEDQGGGVVRGLMSWLRNLWQRRFIRNVATVATGTAASQAIVMAFAPLLTRIYGPEVFGLHGVFMSVVAPLVVLAAAGYPIAVVLPREDGDARGIVRLCVWIGAFSTALATVAVHLFGTDLLRLLNAEDLRPLLYLIPLGMLAAASGDLLKQWLIRVKRFAVIARYGVLTTLMVSSAKVGLGLISPTAAVLILASIVGGMAGTGLTYLGWRREREGEGTEKEAPSEGAPLLELARRHADFPLLRAPQNLINVGSRSLPLLLLAAFFGAEAAGHFTVAMSVLAVPATLIGGAVYSVFYPRVNEAILDGEDVRSLLLRATVGMAGVGILPFLAVVVAGPTLFAFVFGGEWDTSGVYAQWLAIWLFFGFANRPSVSAVPPLRLQGMLLVHEICSVTLRVGALFAGFYILDDAVSAIALYSVAGMVLNIWLIFYVIRKSGKPGAPRE